MANLKSYDSILNSIKEQKKFERESKKYFEEQECSVCKSNLVNNGVSKYNGICQSCVSSSINGKQE